MNSQSIDDIARLDEKFSNVHRKITLFLVIEIKARVIYFIFQNKLSSSRDRKYQSKYQW